MTDDNENDFKKGEPNLPTLQQSDKPVDFSIKC